MTLQQIDRIRGNFLTENAQFFEDALLRINEEVIDMAKASSSSFVFEYRLNVDFDRIAKRHFSRAYDNMWDRTPVYFATETFKSLSNTKALADIFRPLNAFRGSLDRRIKMISNTTSRKYGSLLGEGRKMTNDINQIAEFMNTSVVGAYVKLRAMQIARTETVFASNAGRRAGAGATNLPIVKTWVTMQDEQVRTPHVLANGQQRPLNQPFLVNGELLMFPSDFTLTASASNLVNCRCIESYSIQ